jgi:hypothetical protein
MAIAISFAKVRSHGMAHPKIEHRQIDSTRSRAPASKCEEMYDLFHFYYQPYREIEQRQQTQTVPQVQRPANFHPL